MILSTFRCKKCNRQLFLTNSADYRCSTCQRDIPAREVDPQNKDWRRLGIESVMRIEQRAGK